ncbi:MAG: hypothetical protein JWM64_2173, partial [Frankiales bacterium]|nr:hypothetical protein [Frankiales bacterium]
MLRAPAAAALVAALLLPGAALTGPAARAADDAGRLYVVVTVPGTSPGRVAGTTLLRTEPSLSASLVRADGPA